MLWEPFKVTAPSQTAVGYFETNCQCRNENPSCRRNRAAFLSAGFFIGWTKLPHSLVEPPVYSHWSQHLRASSHSFLFERVHFVVVNTTESSLAVAHIADEFIALLPISQRSCSLWPFQYRGAFKAPLPTQNNNIHGFNYSLRHWQQLLDLFTAPLPTTVCSEKKATNRAMWAVCYPIQAVLFLSYQFGFKVDISLKGDKNILSSRTPHWKGTLLQRTSALSPSL
jgi:hypothetical protein